MYEGNLVICDQEQQYSRNLLQMFARNRETDIQMYLFHTIEEVEKFAEQKPVHTLLIGKEYPPEQRAQIPATEKFVLVKSRQDQLEENEAGIYRYQSAEDIWSQMCYEPTVPQPGKLAKPQSERFTSSQPGKLTKPQSERLTPSQNRMVRPPEDSNTGIRRKRPQKPGADECRETLKNSAARDQRQRQQEFRPEERRRGSRKANPEERKEAPYISETDEIPDRRSEPKADGRGQKTSARYRTNTRGELIGVYSPVHRIGKTRFAMELGREMAKKEPVLYLNMEEYAGGSYYFPDQTGQTLADLLYYSRQEKGNLGLRISTMAGQDEALDYILPIPCVQDLQGVSGEEWLRLFEQIRENCIYQKVILDLGDSVNGLFQILEECHTVYTPYIEDEVARAKLNQYAENLRRTGREKVLEKTIQKKLKQRY
ncbi:hypothetical protein EBB54_25545 [Schaedlerella arabinosiphila]|uniref:Uncharacterized protein n=2 Tax=Schaedlerella arabinosiphila TaxID=2044587 RepID=A0A426DNP7_9FIRM|nr:hypothetical protein EBB54_25545 [Schaedlerella arabinosiphila]